MNDIRRVEPVILEGRKVRLEPLALEHVPLLAAVALDPDLWQWTLARPTDEAGLRAWAESAAVLVDLLPADEGDGISR